MSTSGGDAERSECRASEPASPCDLFDFFRRWVEFRPIAERLADRADLSASERQSIYWLILLVDRISEHDLRPP
jgi:hypothetical protein